MYCCIKWTHEVRECQSCFMMVTISWLGQEIFFSTKPSRPAVGPSQLAVQWVPLSRGLGVMFITRLHLVPRLRMSGGLHLLPLYALWRGQEQLCTLLFADFLRFHFALTLWQHSSLYWIGPIYCGKRHGSTWRAGSMPYLHSSAKIAVFSKLPLRRLSHVKPRPQKRIYIKAPPLGVYGIISYVLKASLCYMKITHTFGVSSFSLCTRLVK